MNRDARTIAEAIDLLRTYHPGPCDMPACCGTCSAVRDLRRMIDRAARPGTSADHARIHGGMFWARRLSVKAAA